MNDFVFHRYVRRSVGAQNILPTTDTTECPETFLKFSACPEILLAINL